MSYGIDVNILLYASDESAPLHDRAKAFLEQCAARGEVLCLAWPTIMGYLRISTHPSIFAHPLTPKNALGNVRQLTTLPHCRVLGEREGFLSVYEEVTREVPARGNLVPDAHIAVLLRQNGVRRLYTHDRDFRKFDFLDVKDPLV
jgi:uncharacterized protein